MLHSTLAPHNVAGTGASATAFSQLQAPQIAQNDGKKAFFLPPVKLVLSSASKAGFKFAEPALQFPLLLRFFARLQKVSARGGWFRGAERV